MKEISNSSTSPPFAGKVCFRFFFFLKMFFLLFISLKNINGKVAIFFGYFCFGSITVLADPSVVITCEEKNSMAFDIADGGLSGFISPVIVLKKCQNQPSVFLL